MKGIAKGATVGLDFGDQKSLYCMVDTEGEIVREELVETTKAGVEKAFQKLPRCRMAMEVGTHSRWEAGSCGR